MDVMISPTKPPRGVKNSKETSGLLMCVIRTLSRSESNEQRDREKAKLEREYKKCDQKLNELVDLHNQDLKQVLLLFGQMSTVITNTRDKLQNIREMLDTCKTLLSCRRDELKKLWFEGVEHKHVLLLLEEIEQLKDIPLKLSTHLGRGDYLEATKILVPALNLGDGALDRVEALRELKIELQSKREKLYEHLLNEVLRIIYMEPNRELTESLKAETAFRGHSKWSQRILDSPQEFNMVEEKIESNYENDLKDLVECLSMLEKLPDAVEKFKSSMQDEVFSVVNCLSKFVVRDNSGEHPLLKLLNMINQQLKKIAIRFKTFLVLLQENSKTSKTNLPSLQAFEIWSAIQSVLQLLLTDYLDIQNTTSESSQATLFPDQMMADISYFYSRRRTPRSRKFPLFKFEYAANAFHPTKESSLANKSISVSSNLKEKLLVCTPDPLNITIIFVPLQKFIEEIETFSQQNGVPCVLNKFLNDYVRDVFIGREHSRSLIRIESATKSSDAWRTSVSPQIVTSLNLPKPILQSTYQVNEAIKELESLLDTLPNHRLEVSDIILGLIKNYMETCYAAYRGIVQPEPEDKRLCSAAWLKDEDINRFLRSLPNWNDLQAQKSFHSSGKSLKRLDTTEEESPEEVRQRNIKEAEILASNLGEGGIGLHEIISDPVQLKSLAQLHESMEWFAFRIANMVSDIKKRNQNTHIDNSESSVLSLNSLAEEFEDLANSCLLVLHLEIRVQCFHYLLPKTNKFADSSHDTDPKVLDLSRILVSVDEAISPNLQQRKSKYIFEGLGYLIAKILMSSIQYLEKFDEGNIHKMCRNIFTLQQTLNNITMTREIALDHARRYFQLFFMSQEEILNQVLEKGPEFSELEYINALQLINRTLNSPEDQPGNNHYLQKLSDILGEVGVTV